MRARFVATCICLALAGAAACSGGPKPVSATGPQSVSSTASRTTPAGVPRVMVQMGTSFVDGVLVQFCTKTCERGPGRPTRTLEGAQPLLFIVDRKPVSARAEIRRSGEAAGETAPLHSGTTMLFAPQPSPGTYVVTLTASWKGHSGSWAFRLKVPAD